MKGDDSGIVVSNDTDETIYFDIVVNSLKGLIFACKFIRTGELLL